MLNAVSTATILEGITGVFSAILTWIVDALADVVPIFWDATAGALTIYGTLSVIGLGISVFFLLMGLFQNFIHFRG